VEAISETTSGRSAQDGLQDLVGESPPGRPAGHLEILREVIDAGVGRYAGDASIIDD
jgi:hypothetical protein